MKTKDITKDIEVDDDENSLDNQNKLKKKPYINFYIKFQKGLPRRLC